jgi:DNA polymerase III epsilon subunit-like protein
MRKHNLAFFDLETTGFDPERHEIIEIGCLVARQVPTAGRGPKLEVVSELDLKVKPQNIATAEPEALRINRYSEADWLFAVDLPQALEAFNAKTAEAVLVAQNISFDWGFLERAYKRCGIKPTFRYHRLDLMSMVFGKTYHEGSPEYFSLDNLAQHFGVKNERAHQALADVRATFEIYKKLLQI